MMPFFLGFYIFDMMSWRSTILDKLDEATWQSSRVLQVMYADSEVTKEARVTIARYLLAGYSMFFIQGKSKDYHSADDLWEAMLKFVDKGLVTENELHMIDVACDANFNSAHRAPFGW